MAALYMPSLHGALPILRDHVRVDRLTDGGAQRVELLRPGTSAIDLSEGTYVFRTSRDAVVRLMDDAAVRVTTLVIPNDKDPWPDPDGGVMRLASKGDGGPAVVPSLPIVR